PGRVPGRGRAPGGAGGGGAAAGPPGAHLCDRRQPPRRREADVLVHGGGPAGLEDGRRGRGRPARRRPVRPPARRGRVRDGRWGLAVRGRNVAGGMVWGLLAFKPVWAAAFFLVPLLTRRWRFALAMLGTGAALGLATLPFVGLQTWFDWLAVGREATGLYNV